LVTAGGFKPSSINRQEFCKAHFEFTDILSASVSVTLVVCGS